MRRSKLFSAGFLALAFISVGAGSVSHQRNGHKLTRPAALNTKLLAFERVASIKERPIDGRQNLRHSKKTA